jgi:hypothetical protein
MNPNIVTLMVRSKIKGMIVKEFCTNINTNVTINVSKRFSFNMPITESKSLFQTKVNSSALEYIKIAITSRPIMVRTFFKGPPPFLLIVYHFQVQW